MRYRTILIAGIALTGCPQDGAPPNTFLVVELARAQPIEPSTGVLVDIQSQGGKAYRIRAVDGTFQRSVDESPRSTACIPVQPLLPVAVFPVDAEALFFVDLLPNAPPAGAEAAGDGGAGGALSSPEDGRSELERRCPGDALESVLVVVSPNRPGGTTGVGGAGGGGGGGGAGGAGGAGGGGGDPAGGGGQGGAGGSGGAGGTGGQGGGA